MKPTEIFNALVNYNNLLQTKNKDLIKAVFANANSIEFPEVNFTDFQDEKEFKLYFGLTGNTLIGVLMKESNDGLSDIITGNEVYVSTFSSTSTFTVPTYQPVTDFSVSSLHAMSVIDTWLNKKNDWIDAFYESDNLARLFMIPAEDILNNDSNKGYLGLITDENGNLELDLITSNVNGLFDVTRCSPPYGGWPPQPGDPKPKDTKPKPKALEDALQPA